MVKGFALKSITPKTVQTFLMVWDADCAPDLLELLCKTSRDFELCVRAVKQAYLWQSSLGKPLTQKHHDLADGGVCKSSSAFVA